MGRRLDRLAPLMASAPALPFMFPSLASTFTFVPSPLPTTTLSFPSSNDSKLTAHHPTPQKRTRPLTDIDGELSSPRKKKRRLRLFLITSRLSQPFSAPATNIVDRGSSKIAVWAKQKALGRNLLRKAAIMNGIRRNAVRTHTEGRGLACVLDQEREQKQLELARLAFLYGGHDTHTRPVFQRPPNFPPAGAVRSGNYFTLSGSPNAASLSIPRPASSNSSVSEAAISPNMPGNANPTNDEHEPERRRTEDEFREGDEREDMTYTSPNAIYTYPLPHAAQLPRHDYLPLPPSPLGLSNYDAFDLEDEIHDPYSAFDDDDAAAAADDGSHSSPAFPPHPASASWLDLVGGTTSARDEDMHDAPASPNWGSPNTAVSYVTDSTLSSVQTPPPLLQQPPRMLYSDFSVLDPDEAVVGDYDGVDGVDGVTAVWPTVSSGEAVGKQTPTAGEGGGGRRWGSR